MNTDYFEALQNSDGYRNDAGIAYGDNYNFNVGDIMLDIDRYSDFSNTSIDESHSYADSRQDIFETTNIVNNAGNDGSDAGKAGAVIPFGAGVTVNFNAYNEVRSVTEPSSDIGNIMTQFSERLAEAVALAAEGVHL